MKTIISKLGILLVLFMLSCSSSSDDISDSPPNNDTPPSDPSSYSINLITDSFEGENFVVIGSEGWNFMVAFHSELEGESLSFTVIDGELPVIMEDDMGSRYNIFGTAIDGINEGKQLTPMNAYMGYWFSWGAFFPGLDIFDSNLPVQNQGESVNGSQDWLIPREEVYVGALRDAIPAIDSPQYTNPKDDSFINSIGEKALVIGVCIDNQYKSYPHAILNWHEIVNDEINESYYSVVFCPLTGTATVWNRFIDGEVTTFGVSGFLYNSNVVPYDRKTSSNWSQMLQMCVQGELSSSKTDNLFVLETSIETWSRISTSNRMLSTDTGFNRSYNINPYGSYPTSLTVNFPLNFSDDRLHPKERVLGVIVNEKAKAYRFESFK
ncbi:DUF3179 domain-containing (seleno)protein [Marinifilum caeruleilacunae]|uniref:DUF3179 domain-containing protein n=1 Tax=Marinifilum caeruleilacunae TaxID=2499076 RepID=A0ABX1WRK7_9BACT|nr:DUF3179 domain-containing (seleno)protein [Marinifilum caeruleilacunae]NOU58564.1 DUF3179 domain-containing protein [Marinifilum caeruleilacunae]